jgi:branched-chain amino acid aminotransferase
MPRIKIWKYQPCSAHTADIVALNHHHHEDLATLDAASRLLPAGVYTTFRTYAGRKILPLEDHIRRLEESARLVGSPISLDQAALQAGLRQAMHCSPGEELRIRITVDLQEEPGTLYFSVAPLRIPSPQDYENGVLAVTCRLQRQNPRAKQTQFITLAETVRRKIPPEANEGLLLDENDFILEGLSSNFFAVKQGEVWTAGEGVLSGIARAAVIQVAEREGPLLRLEKIARAEIPTLQEAFLTSSSRSILPIHQIDETLIGSGRPGPVTQNLVQAYWQEIEKKLVEI